MKLLSPVDLVEEAAPSTPGSGFGRWFVGNDGMPTFIDDSGRITDLTLGSKLNDRALRRMRTNLGNVAAKPFDIVAIGDSITEGYSASTDANRWTSLLRDALQDQFNPVNVPGGEGYIASRHTVDPAAAAGNLANRFTFVNVATPWTHTAGFGLAFRYVQMTATNQSATITVFGDRIWVHFVQGSGAGSSNIIIDGVTTVVNNNNATLTSVKWDSGQLARGFHTVTISPNVGDTYFEGITVFDGDGGSTYDTGAGVRMWEAGSYGSRSSTWNVNDYEYRTLQLMRPDLILLGFIINDAGNATDLATYETNLTAIINNIKWFSGEYAGALAPSFILWAPPNSGTVTDAVWKTYLDVMRKVALAMGCAFVDFGDILPTYAVNPVGFAADNVHYGDANQKALAIAMKQVIAPSRIKRVNTPGVGLFAARPAATGSMNVYLATDQAGGTQYQDTAVGVWTQISNHDIELAFGQNIGGTGTIDLPTSGNGLEVPNCFITVEPCSRPVYLECRATGQQITTAALGTCYFYIYEVNPTTGAITRLVTFTAPLPNSIAATTKFFDIQGKFRLGPVLTERSFLLAGMATSATQILGGTGTPAYLGAFTA